MTAQLLTEATAQDLGPCLARKCPRRIRRGAVMCDPHLDELPEQALDAITIAEPGTTAYTRAALAAIGFVNEAAGGAR